MPVFKVREDQYAAALAAPSRRRARASARRWAGTRTTWKRAREDGARDHHLSLPARTRSRADAPKLKLLQILGAGVDYLLPLDWVPPRRDDAHQQRRARAQGRAIGADGALDAQRAHARARHGASARTKWNRVFTDTLEGKTLLIVGVGAIGGGIAEHAKQFGMSVLGIRRSGAAAAGRRRDAHARRAARAAAARGLRDAQHCAHARDAIPDRRAASSRS